MSPTLLSLITAGLAQFTAVTRLYELILFPRHSGTDPANLLVEAFAADDLVHGTGARDVIALATDPQVDGAILLGTEATLEVTLADGTRSRFGGEITQVASLGSDGGFARYRLRLTPWLWRLRCSLHSRVWQDKSVMSIVDDVFVAAGPAWINLNAADIHKSSDADFPDWRGWTLVDDDTDDDSRAESPLLAGAIEDASNADGMLQREELERRLGLPEVRTKLAKCICKFPSEWNRDSIDARWGWLQSDPDYGLTGEDWTRLRAHIEALTVPAAALPAPLAAAH